MWGPRFKELKLGEGRRLGLEPKPNLWDLSELSEPKKPSYKEWGGQMALALGVKETLYFSHLPLVSIS